MNSEFNTQNISQFESNNRDSQNNKNDKWKDTLILILAIIVFILTVVSLYLVIDKKDNDAGNNKDNNIQENESDNNEKNQIKNELLKKVYAYNTIIDNFSIDNTNEYFNNISNQKKLSFLWSKVKKEDIFAEGFTKKELRDIAFNYFGESFSYIDENIYCDEFDHVIFEYNTKKEKYEYNINHPGHGGYTCFSNVYFVDDKIDNNTYTMNVKILYSDTCGDIGESFSSKYYSDKELNNLVYDNTENNTHDEVYEVIKDKLPTTTYKFVKNSSNEYILSSVSVK